MYPAYRTAGALDEAVALFTEWLINNVAEREEAMLNGQTDGKGKWADREQAKIVLLAHRLVLFLKFSAGVWLLSHFVSDFSMGGLVAADTIIGLADTYASTGIPPCALCRP